MVFVREIGIGVFVEPNYLYDTYQHYRLLDTLFQSGLLDVSDYEIVCTRTNLEQPIQLCAVVYRSACVG